MLKIGFSKSELTRPTNPDTFRIEEAIDCDGSECGSAVRDEDENLLDLPPHYHLVMSQKGAATMIYPIGGSLPGEYIG